VASAAPAPEEDYRDVDVAIVMESTYPYLKGGVSAVVHDIVTMNPDLSFGIIHITWDSKAPHEDLYGIPANVHWIKPVYISMDEHEADFRRLRPRDLRLRRSARRRLANRLYDALHALLEGDVDPLWQLYDEGMNPRTRSYPLWALLGSEEFMSATVQRLPQLGLPLTDTFWVMREFFSLACAILGVDIPRARVYHAHTTGYAALLGAAGARQNGTKFLLTEHNLYVRDTINFMLERSPALSITAQDWRDFTDVPPAQRAWMTWFIEMGRFCYPSAETITYLYPTAISEAADLGAPVEKSVVIPNGIRLPDFDAAYRQRLAVLEDVGSGRERVWKLVYIARVVLIKGLSDLIETIDILVHQRGVTNFHLDILGPTDHEPAYYQMCVDKIARLGVGDYMTFHGTVNVRDHLGDYDIVVLPSYNEGQPVVVLEAMTAGIPVAGTKVGGMAQLIDDPLTDAQGRTWGPCGLLVTPDYAIVMADMLQRLMGDPALYVSLARNARGRVENFFQLQDAMAAYNRLYRETAATDVLAPAATVDPVSEGGSSTDRRSSAVASVPAARRPTARALARARATARSAARMRARVVAEAPPSALISDPPHVIDLTEDPAIAVGLPPQTRSGSAHHEENHQ